VESQKEPPGNKSASLELKIALGKKRRHSTSQQMDVLCKNISPANRRIKDVDVVEKNTHFARVQHPVTGRHSDVGPGEHHTAISPAPARLMGGADPEAVHSDGGSPPSGFICC
jgi:hypothetical protein